MPITQSTVRRTVGSPAAAPTVSPGSITGYCAAAQPQSTAVTASAAVSRTSRYRRARSGPYLGVTAGRLTPAIKQRLGVQADAGALVIEVDPGGPAATAGLRPGDVITALAEQPVSSVEDLLGALRRIEPGQPASVTVARGDEQQQLSVTVGERSG